MTMTYTTDRVIEVPHGLIGRLFGISSQIVYQTRTQKELVLQMVEAEPPKESSLKKHSVEPSVDRQMVKIKKEDHASHILEGHLSRFGIQNFIIKRRKDGGLKLIVQNVMAVQSKHSIDEYGWLWHPNMSYDKIAKFVGPLAKYCNKLFKAKNVKYRLTKVEFDEKSICDNADADTKKAFEKLSSTTFQDLGFEKSELLYDRFMGKWHLYVTMINESCNWSPLMSPAQEEALIKSSLEIAMVNHITMDHDLIVGHATDSSRSRWSREAKRKLDRVEEAMANIAQQYDIQEHSLETTSSGVVVNITGLNGTTEKVLEMSSGEMLALGREIATELNQTLGNEKVVKRVVYDRKSIIVYNDARRTAGIGQTRRYTPEQLEEKGRPQKTKQRPASKPAIPQGPVEIVVPVSNTDISVERGSQGFSVSSIECASSDPDSDDQNNVSREISEVFPATDLSQEFGTSSQVTYINGRLAGINQEALRNQYDCIKTSDTQSSCELALLGEDTAPDADITIKLPADEMSPEITGDFELPVTEAIYTENRQDIPTTEINMAVSKAKIFEEYLVNNLKFDQASAEAVQNVLLDHFTTLQDNNKEAYKRMAHELFVQKDFAINVKGKSIYVRLAKMQQKYLLAPCKSANIYSGYIEQALQRCWKNFFKIQTSKNQIAFIKNRQTQIAAFFNTWKTTDEETKQLLEKISAEYNGFERYLMSKGFGFASKPMVIALYKAFFENASIRTVLSENLKSRKAFSIFDEFFSKLKQNDKVGILPLKRIENSANAFNRFLERLSKCSKN